MRQGPRCRSTLHRPRLVKPRTRSTLCTVRPYFRQCTPRVFGDVAADGAGDLAAGVGRVVQAVRCGRLADGEVAHPHCTARCGPGSITAGMRLKRQRQGSRPAHAAWRRQTGPMPVPRAIGYAQAVAGAQHGLHLGFGFGQTLTASGRWR